LLILAFIPLFLYLPFPLPPISTLFPYTTLFRSNRRQLNSLQNTWPYGYSMPIAVRYTQDAFSRSGWLWPVDAKGEPLKATRPQRSEERFSRNAETDLVCRLLLEKKKKKIMLVVI